MPCMLLILPSFPVSVQPATKTVRELNLSNNRCGDNGLFTLKLGLLANRALEKLNLSNTRMTCEGEIRLLYAMILTK